jgi:hypothetical protein
LPEGVGLRCGGGGHGALLVERWKSAGFCNEEVAGSGPPLNGSAESQGVTSASGGSQSRALPGLNSNANPAAKARWMAR